MRFDSNYIWSQRLQSLQRDHWNESLNPWDITEHCSIDIEICVWPQNKPKNSPNSQYKASSRAKSSNVH